MNLDDGLVQPDSAHIDTPAPEVAQADAPASQAEPTQEPASAEPDTVEHDTPAPAAADKAVGDEAPAEKPKSMLSYVEKILGLGKKDEAKPAAVKAPAKDVPAKPAAQQPGAAEVVPVEVANHPAYKSLQERAAADSRHAEAFRGLQGYMAENGVSSEDTKRSLHMAVLARKDPKAFVAEMRKVISTFEISLGERLPEDLQEDFDNGAITMERAQELSRARLRAQNAENGLSSAADIMAARDEQEAIEENEALTLQWFKRREEKDPRIVNHVNAIHGEVLRLVNAEGPAQDQQAYIRLLNRAYNNVIKAHPAKPRSQAPTSPAPDYSKTRAPANEGAVDQRQGSQVDAVFAIMNKHANKNG